jgi:hypothetical protein
MGRKPQVWLKDGDVVEVGLENVGTWYVAKLRFPKEPYANLRNSTNKVEFTKPTKARI